MEETTSCSLLSFLPFLIIELTFSWISRHFFPHSFSGNNVCNFQVLSCKRSICNPMALFLLPPLWLANEDTAALPLDSEMETKC